MPLVHATYIAPFGMMISQMAFSSHIDHEIIKGHAEAVELKRLLDAHLVFRECPALGVDQAGKSFHKLGFILILGKDWLHWLGRFPHCCRVRKVSRKADGCPNRVERHGSIMKSLARLKDKTHSSRLAVYKLGFLALFVVLHPSWPTG
jgi:hypothetical protein